MRERALSRPVWPWALLFGAAYMLLAGACDLLFRFGEDEIAIFWVPSALTLAVFLRTPVERWGLFAGSLFVGAAIEVMWLGHPLPVALGWAFGVVLEPLIGATLMRRWLRVGPGLAHTREVLALVGVGAFAAPMLGGIYGATVAAWLLDRPWLHSWTHWWMSAGLGVVLFAPFFLSSGVRPRPRWRPSRVAELAALVVATAFLADMWSRVPTGSPVAVPLAASITVPMLIWGALRFGIAGTAAVSVTLAVTASWYTARSQGPFLDSTGEVEFVSTQVFFALMSVGGLVLAATLNERLRAEAGQRLLADVGALLAETNDEVAALRRVVNRVVPELADGCAITLEREGLPPKLIAARHVDPERERALREVAQGIAAAPLHTGQLTHEDLPGLIGKGGPAEALSALGPTTLVARPLRADGKASGTLLLVDGEPEGRFDASQLLLADEVARRCSMALLSARLRREQEQAIHSRDDFLSIASHELKTPLTPLVLQLARMTRRVESGGQIKADWIEKARNSAQRLSALIEDLLDAGKIASGRLALRLEPITLAPLLREVTSTFSSASARHSIELRLPEAPVSVWGDRFRLEQVLANLLDNAIKYSPLGGTITVSLDVEGDRAVISVADQGIGIPADQQAHLFERFFRARNSPSQLFGGLGLGLFICRDIIQRHGGEITVQSRPGEGSTFRIELPIHKALSPGEADERPPQEPAPAELQ